MAASVPSPYRPLMVHISLDKIGEDAYCVQLGNRKYLFENLTSEKIKELQDILNWFPNCCVEWLRVSTGRCIRSTVDGVMQELIKRYGKLEPVATIHDRYCANFGNPLQIWEFLGIINDVQTSLIYVSSHLHDMRSSGDCIINEVLAFRVLSAYLSEIRSRND